MSFIVTSGIEAGIAAGISTFLKQQHVSSYVGQSVGQEIFASSTPYSSIAVVTHSFFSNFLSNVAPKNRVAQVTCQVSSVGLTAAALYCSSPYLSENFSLSLLTPEQALAATAIALIAKKIFANITLQGILINAGRGGIGAALAFLMKRKIVFSFLGQFIPQNALNFSPLHSAITLIAQSILAPYFIQKSKSQLRRLISEIASIHLVSVALYYSQPALYQLFGLSPLTLEQACAAATIALIGKVFLHVIEQMNRDVPLDELNDLIEESNELKTDLSNKLDDLKKIKETKDILLKELESQSDFLHTNLDSTRQLLKEKTFPALLVAFTGSITIERNARHLDKQITYCENLQNKSDNLFNECKTIESKIKQLDDQIKNKKAHLQSMGYILVKKDDDDN